MKFRNLRHKLTFHQGFCKWISCNQYLCMFNHGRVCKSWSLFKTKMQLHFPAEDADCPLCWSKAIRWPFALLMSHINTLLSTLLKDKGKVIQYSLTTVWRVIYCFIADKSQYSAVLIMLLIFLCFKYILFCMSKCISTEGHVIVWTIIIIVIHLSCSNILLAVYSSFSIVTYNFSIVSITMLQ